MAISNDPNDPNFGLETDPTHPQFGLAHTPPTSAPAVQPIIPRSGAQMESLEAREFTRTSPDQVRGTGDQPVIPIPRVPQQRSILGQLGAGAVNIGAGLAEMAETPANIAALPVAPAKLSQILFAGQAFKDIGTAFEEARQPGTSIQKGLELGGRALTDALFGVGMARGAIEPVAPLTERAAVEATKFQPLIDELHGLIDQGDALESKGQPIPTELIQRMSQLDRYLTSQGVKPQPRPRGGEVSATKPISATGTVPIEQGKPTVGETAVQAQEGDTRKASTQRQEVTPVPSPGQPDTGVRPVSGVERALGATTEEFVAPKTGNMPRGLVAATRSLNGEIFTGKTHAEAYAALEDKYPSDYRQTVDHGFLTPDGQFLDRFEAARYARGLPIETEEAAASRLQQERREKYAEIATRTDITEAEKSQLLDKYEKSIEKRSQEVRQNALRALSTRETITTEGGVSEKEVQKDEGQGREGVLSEPAAGETPPSPAAAAPQGASPPATPTTAVRPIEQPEPKSPTSLKNEIVDQQRVERGLSPRMQQARQSFGTFWDDAIKDIDQANQSGAPHPADELVKRFQEKPFALGPKEDALILHRQVELENAADQIGLEQEKARASGDQSTIQSNNDRMAVVLDSLNDTYNVGQAGGRLTAQGLAFRRQMVNEDFSLGSMVNKKKAVNNGEISERQLEDVQYYNREILAADKKLQEYQRETSKENAKVKAARTRLEMSKTDLERRIAFQDFEKAQRQTAPTLDPQSLKLQSEVEKLKQEFQRDLIRDMLRKRTPFEKFQDTAVKWSRLVKLSSVNVFPKLIQAGLIRQIAEPVSRVVGQPLRFISPRTFEAARAETGITVRSQAANLAGVLSSPKKLWEKLTTQKSDLDVLSGKRARDVEMMNFVGNIHGVIKEPVRQGAYRETVQLETEKAIKEGLDVRDPVVQTAIQSRGVEQADRRIFMQDNPFSRYLVRNVVGGLRNAGKTQVGLRTLANTLDFLMPIVRVSSNIAVHTARLQAGLPEAFIRLAIAAKRGQLGRGATVPLPEAEALTIARAYKTGSMGLLLGAYAWTNPQYFGGAFGEGPIQKGELKPGDIKTPWFTIPHQINHYPEASFLNTVASARRVYDRYMAKNPDKKLDAQLEAAAFATMTPVKNFPMVDVWLRTFASHNSPAEVLAAMARDATIPTAIPSLLTAIEERQGIERKPKGPLEEIEMSIPGLRSKVSEKQDRQSSKSPILMQ